jgi:hypothetical protein
MVHELPLLRLLLRLIGQFVLGLDGVGAHLRSSS